VEWRDCELYLSGSGQGQVAGVCKEDNETSVFYNIQGNLLTGWWWTSKEWLFFVEVFGLLFLGIVCLFVIYWVG